MSLSQLIDLSRQRRQARPLSRLTAIRHSDVVVDVLYRGAPWARLGPRGLVPLCHPETFRRYRSTLSSAAAEQLGGERQQALHRVIRGLAAGAHNGLAACLLARATDPACP